MWKEPKNEGNTEENNAIRQRPNAPTILFQDPDLAMLEASCTTGFPSYRSQLLPPIPFLFLFGLSQVKLGFYCSQTSLLINVRHL